MQTRTHRFNSLPGSTPTRPPSLDMQKRSWSASSALERLNHTNNGVSSSSFPPLQETIDSPPEHLMGQSITQQHSVTSSVSSVSRIMHVLQEERTNSLTNSSLSLTDQESSSVYTTPMATTPEGACR